MADSGNAAASGGIGFTGLLTIAFIVLKLTHYIDWRWRWVLAPIWIAVGFWLAVLAVIVLVFLWAAWSDRRAMSLRRKH